MKQLSVQLSIILVLSLLTSALAIQSKTLFINVQNKAAASDAEIPRMSLVLNNTVSTVNTGQANFNQQWELRKIQAPEAWTISKSSKSVKIAILDSGIDSGDKDLASKIVAERNFTDSQTAEDKYGHGTFVAGVAAAADNASGIAGVGNNASLMNVKVLDDTGKGSYKWIIQGIIWATDNGANIINLSMDCGVDSPDLKKAIDYAWDKGVLVVVAAGNSRSNIPTFPAGYGNSVAVAATDRNDHKCQYSNYGNWIDVAAPGEAYSTFMGNKYGYMSGTSVAAPYVSGLAALAFTIARDANGDGKLNDEVRTAIEHGCDQIGDPGTGNGRINAVKTLTSLLSTQSN